ncbi:uncharacterized protein LOC133897041 [Phragmites australis]|uniref:uncharacterized protein LOC133897041 n=1 Tax=Phragmites australis TaxID=29695 RepID=UPI002D78C976|nr:uncharacterized protein LOC133897041 [Phragmites australis]
MFEEVANQPAPLPSSPQPAVAMSSSSVPRACGWEIALAPGGFFTEAELAAADQLVQLSFNSGGGGGDEESSSPRSVNTCTGTAAWEAGEDMVVGGLGVELDRRARKRYRLLSELYAATRPVRGSAASSRKRKRDYKPEAAMVKYGEEHDGERWE